MRVLFLIMSVSLLWGCRTSEEAAACLDRFINDVRENPKNISEYTGDKPVSGDVQQHYGLLGGDYTYSQKSHLNSVYEFEVTFNEREKVLAQVRADQQRCEVLAFRKKD